MSGRDRENEHHADDFKIDMKILAEIGHALWMAFAMFWEILWPLILGFGLSGVVQAVVSKGEMSKLLPDDSPKTLAIATGLGAASSSCSYAAVALARSIFRKGADLLRRWRSNSRPPISWQNSASFSSC